MVNLMKAQRPLLHWLIKRAGLRQETIEIEPGTVISFWLPKHKAKNKKSTNNQANNVQKPTDISSNTQKKDSKTTAKKDKPAVVLVHGFAAEGIDTWQFQIGALNAKYDVYVPDLLFFGGSFTSSSDRSPAFQARCLTTALERIGVQRCTVVGFSYGGMVAFKMAEMRPDVVESLVVSGSVIAMTDSISETTLSRLGVSSSADLLMPENVKGLKALLKIATYKKIWFPDCLHKDYLEIMFTNRKEREELLDGLVISNKDAKIPQLEQRTLLLWGENDNIFNVELAKTMKEQLGEKATLQSINKAGHLVHLERPCAYNRHLKKFLSALHYQANTI